MFYQTGKVQVKVVSSWIMGRVFGVRHSHIHCFSFDKSVFNLPLTNYPALVCRVSNWNLNPVFLSFIFTVSSNDRWQV